MRHAEFWISFRWKQLLWKDHLFEYRCSCLWKSELFGFLESHRQRDAHNSAVARFNSWIEDKEGVGDDEDRQILEHVKSFFELHAHSRFFDLDEPEQKIANMAGYKRVYQNGVIFYVSPSVFQNEICRGFHRKAVIQLLMDKEFLLKDHNGDYRQQKWTPYGNKKVYVISGKILLG